MDGSIHWSIDWLIGAFTAACSYVHLPRFDCVYNVIFSCVILSFPLSIQYMVEKWKMNHVMCLGGWRLHTGQVQPHWPEWADSTLPSSAGHDSRSWTRLVLFSSVISTCFSKLWKSLTEEELEDNPNQSDLIEQAAEMVKSVIPLRSKPSRVPIGVVMKDLPYSFMDWFMLDIFWQIEELRKWYVATRTLVLGRSLLQVFFLQDFFSQDFFSQDFFSQDFFLRDFFSQDFFLRDFFLREMLDNLLV